MIAVIQSLSLPFGQLADRGFISPMLKALLGAVIAFAGIFWLADAGVAALTAGEGWWSTLARLFGAALVLVASVWLFVPVTLAIAGLFLEEVAAAVEAKHYPWLPPASGASVLAQGWAGLVLALQVLGLTLVVLPVVLMLPPVGVILLWVLASVSLGYGFFEAVAQRRMSVTESRVLRRQWRMPVLAVGAGLGLMASVPGLNLLVPVIGTAAMTHLMHRLRRPASGFPVSRPSA
ncbi:EI24 domain-containing protein [Acetobacteraceae bacterium H6797]|nr:EI24 domain-containing protein [Acetobacteraceae bacterium H6797]